MVAYFAPNEVTRVRFLMVLLRGFSLVVELDALNVVAVVRFNQSLLKIKEANEKCIAVIFRLYK